MASWKRIDNNTPKDRFIMTMIPGAMPAFVIWCEDNEGHGRYVMDPELFASDEDFKYYFYDCGYAPQYWDWLPETRIDMTMEDKSHLWTFDFTGMFDE